MPLGAWLLSHSCLQEAIAFKCSSMMCERANKNALESVGISWNMGESQWSGRSTRYVWKFNATMHSLISYTFNDLDCLHAHHLLYHHQSYCHPHSLSTPIISHAFLHLSHQVTIQLHHDIASQQHGPDSAMPQPTPNAIFGAHLNPLTQSVPTQPALSQATHLPHPSPAIPIASSQLAPVLPTLQKWSKQHPKLPHQTITRHPCLALKPLCSVLLFPPDSCTSPCIALEDLINLGKWKARLVLKVLFCPPSILHLM